MIQSRKEALETRYKMSFKKDKVLEEIKKDPIIMDLVALYDKFKVTRSILTDSSKTGFYFVTIPQALPISVVKRFISMVRNFEIPIGGVFVNMVLVKDQVEKDTTGYLKAKYEEQQRYLEMIRRDLGEYIRGYVKIYDRDITGIDYIKYIVDDLYNFKPE